MASQPHDELPGNSWKKFSARWRERLRKAHLKSDTQTIQVNLTLREVYALLIATGAELHEVNEFGGLDRVPWDAITPTFRSLFIYLASLADRYETPDRG